MLDAVVNYYQRPRPTTSIIVPNRDMVAQRCRVMADMDPCTMLIRLIYHLDVFVLLEAIPMAAKVGQGKHRVLYHMKQVRLNFMRVAQLYV